MIRAKLMDPMRKFNGDGIKRSWRKKYAVFNRKISHTGITGPNLGVVELTIAFLLYLAFDLPMISHLGWDISPIPIRY